MQAPAPRQWWAIVVAALAIVVMWPPAGGKSLGVIVVNWAVDPANHLPVLPPQLALGQGDDPEAVEARDAVVRHYDALYAKGGGRGGVWNSRWPASPSGPRRCGSC